MAIHSHYVPKFYLKNFVPFGHRSLWVFHKKTKEFKKQSPKDTAVVKNLYMSSTEKKQRNKSLVESFFMPLESRASRIIKKWLNIPLALDRQDMETVLPFLAYMHCRVPRDFNMTREILKIAYEEGIELIKERSADLETVKSSYERFCQDTGNKRSISFEDFEKMSKDPSLGGKFTFAPTEDYVKGSTFDKAIDIGKYLARMNWYLMVAEKNSHFITNDCPLNVFVLDKNNMAMFGAGFGVANVEVTLPLSPDMCLRLDYSGRRNTVRVTKAYVHEINKRLIHMAENYIFSSHKTNELEAMINQYGDTLNKPKVDIKELREQFKKRLKQTSFKK